jgi:hypothetical protein
VGEGNAGFSELKGLQDCRKSKAVAFKIFVLMQGKQSSVCALRVWEGDALLEVKKY